MSEYLSSNNTQIYIKNHNILTTPPSNLQFAVQIKSWVSNKSSG